MSPQKDRQPVSPVPRDIVDRCYESWFAALDDRQSAIEAIDAICAEYPEHAAGIRALRDGLGSSDGLLNRVSEEIEAPPNRGGGQRIGAYEIEETLGYGGFGAVYRALQHEPVRRRVALKVLQPGRQNERAIARFSSEREALARMQHANIAQVYDAGTASDGQPFIAMELVDGVPITTYCDREKLGVDARLQLFREVCAGVLHAHQRGIVHRDLKPSNILVSESEGEPRPKIIDFGLAKAMDEELGEGIALTIEGGFVGTPGYTSPEQAAGRPVDTRTDEHALGILLYELLTGDLPYDRQRMRSCSLAEALRIVRETVPRAPSRALSSTEAPDENVATLRNTTNHRLRRRLSGDLDRIVLTAIAPQQDERYPSVAALADDVQRFLEHLPIAARRQTIGYVLRKLARHHRIAVTMVIALLTTLIVGSSAIAWSSMQVAAAHKRVVAEKDRANFKAYAAELSASKMALSRGEGGLAQRHLDATPLDLRGWEFDLLSKLADDAEIVLAHDSPTISTVWLEDGTLAIARVEHDIEVFDVHERKLARVVPVRCSRYRGFTAVGDGRHILAVLEDDARTLVLVDLLEGRVVRQLKEITTRAFRVAISPDGSLFACQDEGGVLRIGRMDGTGKLCVCELDGLRVTELTFSPDEPNLLLGTRDGHPRKMSLQGAWIDSPFPGSPHTAPIDSIAIDAKRGVMATGDIRDRLVVWDRSTGAVRSVVRLPVAVRCLALDPESGVLFAAGGSSIAAFDITTSERLGTFDGHRSAVLDISLSRDRRWLASAAADHTVRIWRAQPRRDVEEVVLGYDCRDLALDAKRSRIAYASMKGRAFVRDLKTMEVLLDFEFEDEHMSSEYVVFRGDQLVTLGFDGVVRVLDIARGEIVQQATIMMDKARSKSLAIAADGSRIAVLTWENELIVLDAATLDVQRRQVACYGKVRFSPDGKELLLGAQEDGGELFIVDAKTGEELERRAFGEQIGAVEYSPDGEVIAVGLTDCVALLSRDGLREIGRLQGHTEGAHPFGIAFSPNGRRIAVGGLDRFVRIYDRQSHKELLILDSAKMTVANLAFSADGQRLLVHSHRWSAPTVLHVWNATPTRPRDR